MSSALKIKSRDIEIISEIGEIIEKMTGNLLVKKQFSMVQNRIEKRSLQLKMGSLEDYYLYLQKNLDKETGQLVSLLTTHHTFFFREYTHFEIIVEQLENLKDQAKKEGRRTIRVWSAACSLGHEVYSLAMLLDYHLKNTAFDYEIIGTDIDPECVKSSENGVFLFESIKEIPLQYRADHFSRGKGDIEKFVRVKKTLREKVKFLPLNLLKFEGNEFKEKFDIIFIRNCFIYFDTKDMENIILKMMLALNDHGLFVTGVSESLRQLDLGLYSLKGTVYTKKPREKTARKEKNETLLKVLCVDDSPVILKLLKKILSRGNGFEVIGTASNGIEAHEFIKTHKVDLVTLDIHMPKLDGIGYLEKYMNKDHPDVVMISSVERTDPILAKKAFSLGAKDFIEKPSLSNLDDLKDEICSKLKMAIGGIQVGHNIDESFYSSHTGLQAQTDRVVIIFKGSNFTRLSALRESLKKDRIRYDILPLAGIDEIIENQLQGENIINSPDDLLIQKGFKRHIFLTLEICPRDLEFLKAIEKSVVFYEDSIKGQEELREQDQYTNYTSYSYLTLKIFEKDGK